MAGGTADVGEGREQAFGTSELLAAFRAEGVEECVQDEYWVAGGAGVGLKVLVVFWERGRHQGSKC